MNLELPSALIPILEAIADEAQQAGVKLYLVGGFVRDLIMGHPNTDLDLVVEGDAIAFARQIQSRFGGQIEPHPVFITATWTPPAGAFPNMPAFIDFATARTETYITPGALPSVQPATIADDLKRRDFTINTLALPLFGELIDLFDGQRDLKRGIIRVLHDQSFIDDPTRMLRAARFEWRFRFALEPQTDQLIADALPFLDVVSGERLRHEIDLTMREKEPELVLTGLEAVGILERLGLHFASWQANAIFAARGLRAQSLWGNFGIDLEIVNWIILGCDLPNIAAMADRLRLPKALTNQIEQGQEVYHALPELTFALMPSEVAALLDGVSYNALMAGWAIAGLISPARDLLNRYATAWRDVQPTLNGDDLIRMGLRPGPKIGKLLSRLRDAWLDNEIASPEEEKDFVEDWISKETNVDGD